MYFHRSMTKELRAAAAHYPVVTLTGPRQSGKTTLVQHVFPNKPYINLEAPDIRLVAKEDPRQFLSQFPKGVILDEIQQVPELLSYIQVQVDQHQKKGEFILTGSHQLSLNQAVTQSLAGRTAVLHLLPLSLSELSESGHVLPMLEQVWKGFYPRIYQDQLDPTRTYRYYLQTYLERDVRQLVHIQDLHLFQQFIRLCAGRIGQLFNQHSVATELGISSNTVKSWLTLLEASYILFRLQPYHANISKRLVKTPKFYFTDVGLACYLLGIENLTQLERDPLKGALFENMVVMELVKHRLNQGLDPQMYFYRDSQGHEVDVFFKAASRWVPIEIKSSQTFHPDFLKGIRYAQKLLPDQIGQGYLIYNGEFEQAIDAISLLHYKHTTHVFSHH